MASDWVKDPDATLDFKFDWTDVLEDGESITASEFVVSSGLTKGTTAFAALFTTVWISGGQDGGTYSITNKITTNSTPARIYVESRTLRVTSQ